MAKNLNYCIKKKFKKITESGQTNEKIQKIMNKRKIGLATDDQICQAIYEENKNKIYQHISELSDGNNKMCKLKFWKLRSQLCPKIEKTCTSCKNG